MILGIVDSWTFGDPLEVGVIFHKQRYVLWTWRSDSSLNKRLNNFDFNIFFSSMVPLNVISDIVVLIFVMAVALHGRQVKTKMLVCFDKLLKY